MCFSLSWIEQLCVWLIIVCAVVAIIRLLIPFVTGLIGLPIVGQIINIMLWAIVAIMVVYIAFAVISCLLGGAGMLPHFPR